MKLIDNKNDVLCLDGLIYNALDTALKLSSELCSCYHCRKIELPDLHVEELFGNGPFNDLDGKALCNGCLTDTRGTDKNRIVLGPAVKDLDASLNLFVASDYPVDLAGSGTFGEIRTELA